MLKAARRALSLVMMLQVLLFGLPIKSFSQGSHTFTANGTFTVPVGVTSVTIQTWGGGGKGSTLSSIGVGGGGGGGAYSSGIVSVTSGNNYAVTVGAGSTSTAPGGDSWFNNTSTVLAKGGNSVADNNPAGASGGLASGGVGSTRFSGGNGGSGSGSNAGGGGSSAGTGANGVNGGAPAGGTAPTGGGNGGAGRSGSTGAGTAGSIPGGAGGGAYKSSSGATQAGGNGANGKVTISWTCPTATISYPGTPYCKSVTIPQAPTVTGSAGGTFSALPAGLSIIPASGAITPSSSTAGTYTVTYTIPASEGCGVFTTTTQAIITALPVATFSYTGTPYCSNGANPSPTFSGGGVAGTFSSTAGLVFVSTSTGQVNLAASTAGSYIVTNTIAAAGGCAKVTATSPITITALPIATFSYTNTPYCSNGANPFPTFSGGGVAGKFSSTTGLVFVSTSTGHVN